MFKKRVIKPEDVRSEDIDNIIDKSFYGKESKFRNSYLMIFTFILLFIFYIYLSIIIQNYLVKLMTIIFGIVFLVYVFQSIVYPSLKTK